MPSGEVRPCCRTSFKTGNLKETTLSDLMTSEHLAWFQKNISQTDVFEKYCKSCFDDEREGRPSLRKEMKKNYNKLFQDYGEELEGNLDKLCSLEVRLSNICNQRCLHCEPAFSSEWVKYIGGEIQKLSQGELLRSRLSTEIMSGLKVLNISGGEPLIQKQQFALLEEIHSFAENIELYYNSNLNNIVISPKELVRIWGKFRKVHIKISLDGNPQIYSFFRKGGSLSKVEENLRVIRDLFDEDFLHVSGTFTSCALNITKLVSSIKYFIGLGVFFHSSNVVDPEHLRSRVLPQSLKDKISSEYSDFINNIEREEAWGQNKFWSSERKQLNIERIKKYGNGIISFMNSANEEHLFPELLESIDETKSKKDIDQFFKLYKEFKPFI